MDQPDYVGLGGLCVGLLGWTLNRCVSKMDATIERIEQSYARSVEAIWKRLDRHGQDINQLAVELATLDKDRRQRGHVAIEDDG